MTFSEFHNALRILLNIDMRELVAVGALSDDDTAGWVSFRENPWRWFIRADPDEARAVWRIVQRRQPAGADDALRFYADPANWRTKGHPQIDAHDTAVNADRGDRARAALGVLGP